MNLRHDQIKRIIEAAIFAADNPLSISQLKQIVDGKDEVDNELLRDLVTEISADYADHGVELKEVGSGYRFQVSQDLAPWIARLWEERPPRYSRALLETLALIAYKQPITRAEIESVRGVSVSTNIIRSLMEREWIKIAGHKDVPGKPALYVTTSRFLDYFNLKSLRQMPTLEELRELSDQFDLKLTLGDAGYDEGYSQSDSEKDAE